LLTGIKSDKLKVAHQQAIWRLQRSKQYCVATQRSDYLEKNFRQEIAGQTRNLLTAKERSDQQRAKRSAT